MKYTFKDFEISTVVSDEKGKSVAVLVKQEPEYGKFPEGTFLIAFDKSVSVYERADIELEAMNGVPGCMCLIEK